MKTCNLTSRTQLTSYRFTSSLFTGSLSLSLPPPTTTLLTSSSCHVTSLLGLKIDSIETNGGRQTWQRQTDIQLSFLLRGCVTLLSHVSSSYGVSHNRDSQGVHTGRLLKSVLQNNSAETSTWLINSSIKRIFKKTIFIINTLLNILWNKVPNIKLSILSVVLLYCCDLINTKRWSASIFRILKASSNHVDQ